jgi:hypothetical protein
MNFKSSYLYAMLRSMITACGIKAASLLKISYIIGSYAAFFSASSIALPLVGAWSRVPTIITTCAFGFFIRMMTGASFLPMLAYWVPGLCAALYWQIPSKVYRIGLPLLCMILFVSHPVGVSAAPYAFYWFIPVMIAMMRSRTIWHDALASTFTAHAVGSVIWLYTVPLTAAAWIALIPLVACERMVYASGIVVGHSIIAWCMSLERKSLRKASLEKIHA